MKASSLGSTWLGLHDTNRADDLAKAGELSKIHGR
jgi:hypothetical protein